MSITSLAEDSTLRLAAAKKITTGRLPRSVDAVTAEAARSAAQSVVGAGAQGGALVESAVTQGQKAAQEASHTAPSTPPSSGPLAQLVRYIPTETLTFYVAVQGALGDLKPSVGAACNASFTSRWIWVGVTFVATIGLAVGLSYRSQRNANPGAHFRFKPPVFEPLAAGAAFLVWAFSLPSTPLLDFCGYDVTAWNGVVLLGGTILIASVGYVLGLSVSWQKVLDE